MLTLTVREIYDLACFAGLTINHRFQPGDDEMETELTITSCPSEGVADDDGVIEHFDYVVYFSECPEEGCIPLGLAKEVA